VSSKGGAGSNAWGGAASTNAGLHACVIQKRRLSIVAETTTIVAPRLAAISKRSATSTEPWPCCRWLRAEARMGISKTFSCAFSSTTAAASPREPWASSTRRQLANWPRSWIASSSISTSRRIRSASCPPVPSPPSEQHRPGAPGTSKPLPARLSSGDSLPVRRSGLSRARDDGATRSTFCSSAVISL